MHESKKVPRIDDINILSNGTWCLGKSIFLKELEDKIYDCDDMQQFIIYNVYNFYKTPYILFFASLENKLKLDKCLEN